MNEKNDTSESQRLQKESSWKTSNKLKRFQIKPNVTMNF